MFADLPVRIADPVERLATVRAQMQDLKESHQAVAGSTLTSLGGFAPAMLLALAGRVATRTPQHSVNTVTTNVPGPQHAIYFAGQRMLEYFPFVPLGGHVRIGVAIVSYDGALNFGVTGDYETAPDIQVLCDGIEAGIEELLPQARPRRVEDASGCAIVGLTAPFDGRPPSVLVLGGGGLLGEAWMTGVLAGYEDATGADLRGCRRFVGTSAGSIVAASLVAGRSPRRPGSAEASADPPGRGPRRRAVAVRGPESRGATGAEPRRRRRSGRRPGRRADPGAGAASHPDRAAVDRRASGTRSTGGARRSTGACASAPSTRATAAASCSAAGRRRRLQWGRRSRRRARSRRSSRRCASATGCTSTAAPGRRRTPMPRPRDVAIACCCSSRPPCSSAARCAERRCSRRSRSGAAAPRCRS